MTDYTKFDAALLAAIRTKPQAFAQLVDTALLNALARPHSNERIPTWCIFDRRLQALRKRGLIRHAKGRWEAVDD